MQKEFTPRVLQWLSTTPLSITQCFRSIPRGISAALLLLMIPLLNPLSIVPVPPAKRKPSHEEIARVAHQLYLEQGSQPGYELDDWLRAERIVLEEIHREELSKHSNAKDSTPATPTSPSATSPFRKQKSTTSPQESPFNDAPASSESTMSPITAPLHAITAYRTPQFGLTPSLHKWSPAFTPDFH